MDDGNGPSERSSKSEIHQSSFSEQCFLTPQRKQQDARRFRDGRSPRLQVLRFAYSLAVTAEATASFSTPSRTSKRISHIALQRSQLLLAKGLGETSRNR
jgi:hypothetical protein